MCLHLSNLSFRFELNGIPYLYNYSGLLGHFVFLPPPSHRAAEKLIATSDLHDFLRIDSNPSTKPPRPSPTYSPPSCNHADREWEVSIDTSSLVTLVAQIHQRSFKLYRRISKVGFVWQPSADPMRVCRSEPHRHKTKTTTTALIPSWKRKTKDLEKEEGEYCPRWFASYTDTSLNIKFYNLLCKYTYCILQ